MNRTLTRVLALVGAAVAGAIGLASPATAQETAVTGAYRCVPAIAQWEVTWTVRNDRDVAAQIVEATYDPAHEPQTIRAGAVVPAGGVLTEVLVVTRDTATVGLRVRTAGGETVEQTLTLAGECEVPPEATARFDPRCDGTTLVTFVNTTSDDVTFRIQAIDFDQTVVVAPGANVDPVVVPPNAGTITATRDDGLVHSYVHMTKGCRPEMDVRSTCASLIFTITDPAETFPAVLRPSVGAPQSVTVEPGESATVTFPGTTGLTVEITAWGSTSIPYAWEEPDGCGGTLPITGPPAGLLAGGAGGLLAAGLALFVVAHRRRVRFTA